jgi:hypothetical protein
MNISEQMNTRAMKPDEMSQAVRGMNDESVKKKKKTNEIPEASINRNLSKP